MTAQAWLTALLAFMALWQAVGVITNALETRKRRKVAQKDFELKEKEFKLDSAKFAYRKLLDVKMGNVKDADIAEIEEKFPEL
jgi:uncharacterized membrane-anchored protein YhcB (DUF1043 family)